MVNWAVRHLDETGSTNADLLEQARQGAGEGAVLVADHQTAGRGRQGRTWEAPPGASLLVSVLFRPPAEVAELTAMAVGVAMVDAIVAATGVAARLKWPNDLVVEGADEGQRKVAGILAEADWPARSQASAGWSPPPPTERVAVVVGVGVNCTWPPLDGLPPELADRVVALNHLTGAPVDRDVLLEAFLDRLAARYDALVAGGVEARAALLADWRTRSATLGRRVRVDLGSSDVEGVAVDVDGDGRLVVETDDGERRAFAVGDVVHLR